MLAKDAGKRKRQSQTTIDAFFKKQRVLGADETDKQIVGEPSMINLTEVDDVKVSAMTEEMENEISSQNIEQQEPSSLSIIDSEEEGTLEYEMDSHAAEYELQLYNQPIKLGTPFPNLNHAPGCCQPLPSLNPSHAHTILFRAHIDHGRIPKPYPDSYRDSWDRSHVRMPCSKDSLYPAKGPEKKLISRWNLIRESLLHPMSSSYDLEEAILTYNAHYSKRWNFRNLHQLLLEQTLPEERKEFFNTTLRGIIDLAVNLPTICTQVASLLANAFLCTFPRRNGVRMHSEHEFANYPEINFNRLFQGNNCETSSKHEKLKCLLHYFKRVTQQPPVGTISFKRQVLDPEEVPSWHSCGSSMCRLHISSDGMIEDDAPGLLQGCVQEEIRFVICPELIVSKLFTERLEENECLIITGAERYSNYQGYSDCFKWTGNHNDHTPRDMWSRRYTEIVAIDAKSYSRNADQFSPSNLKRDLNKAFCGFLSRGTEQRHLPAVATGKWGCGAFKGDPELKSLIQIMAASASRRDLMYFTFHDNDHARKLHNIHSLLTIRNVTVGHLWQLLNEYGKEQSSSNNLSLFSYIIKHFQEDDMNNDSDTTRESFDEQPLSPLLYDHSPS